MTFYQKVKKALEEHQPITYPRLADVMGWDSDAVRQALGKLRRRGKATSEKDRPPEGQLWRMVEN